MRVTNALIFLFSLSGMTLAANDFVLHRCIATVELIRRHRKNEPIGVKLSKGNEDLQVSSVARRESETPTNTEPSVTQMEDVVPNLNRLNRTRIDNNVVRKSGPRIRNDTPLKTVSIWAVRKDRPPIFRKKVLLPELEREILTRKVDFSPNVIKIKSIAS